MSNYIFILLSFSKNIHIFTTRPSANPLFLFTFPQNHAIMLALEIGKFPLIVCGLCNPDRRTKCRKDKKMNAECRIAMYEFCRTNCWNNGSIMEFGEKDGIYDIRLNIPLKDVDNIIVPDAYTIGPIYDGEYFSFAVLKDGKRICVVYPSKMD